MTWEETQNAVWKAGEIVPPGTYVRVDDDRHRIITLSQKGPLPATFDGHVALYTATRQTRILTQKQEVQVDTNTLVSTNER